MDKIYCISPEMAKEFRKLWSEVFDSPAAQLSALAQLVDWTTPKTISPAEEKQTPRCDCGAAKANTTHAHWCSTSVP